MNEARGQERNGGEEERMKAREMSAGSGEATRWNAVEVDMEIRRGTNANHR